MTSATPATLISSSTSSPTFAGVLAGSVSFVKQNTGTTSFTGPSTTTGTITVAGGALTLRDTATLLGGGSIFVQQGGNLMLVNGG